MDDQNKADNQAINDFKIKITQMKMQATIMDELGIQHDLDSQIQFAVEKLQRIEREGLRGS